MASRSHTKSSHARAVSRRGRVSVDPGIAREDASFVGLTIVLIFVAHAMAYLAHEYSHATTAWLLGWMRSPLGIDYGHLTLSNILFQQDVGDGVDYQSIFAAGHGPEASLIALAGPGVGNGLLYVGCVLLLRRDAVRARPMLAAFLYWLAVMGAGNVGSYAPIRTVTTHADMALVARGLGISPGLLPLARQTFLARGPVADAFGAVLTCYLFFGFFGAAVFDGVYGEVSALFSIASMFVAFPVATVLCLSARSGPTPSQTRSRELGRQAAGPL